MTKKFENAIKAVKPDEDKLSLIPYDYDLGLEDLSGLAEYAMSGPKDAVFYAIVKAFMFGFVMGNRATISRKMKRL
jgi:hypothetical protein